MAAFLSVHTQWNQSGMGGRTGLRYEGAIALLREYLPVWAAEDPAFWGGVAVADLMPDVQLIESAMLGADAERAEAERAQKPIGHAAR